MVDDTTVLSRPRKGSKLKEEVWQTEDGTVTKYNLAYINRKICALDHGRVLGYDNNHGYHHRHLMGLVASYAFGTYQTLFDTFIEEIHELWRKEDDQSH